MEVLRFGRGLISTSSLDVIWLPSGIEIKVRRTDWGVPIINIYVTGLSGEHYTGLCTEVYIEPDLQAVPDSKNLFNLPTNLPKCVSDKYVAILCKCKQNNDGTSSVCETDAIAGTPAVIYQYVNMEKCGTPTMAGKTRRKRSLSKHDNIDVLVDNTNFYPTVGNLHEEKLPPVILRWPTVTNKITERQATDACLQSMRMSPAYDLCNSQKIINVATYMESCKLDIQVMATSTAPSIKIVPLKLLDSFQHHLTIRNCISSVMKSHCLCMETISIVWEIQPATSHLYGVSLIQT